MRKKIWWLLPLCLLMVVLGILAFASSRFLLVDGTLISRNARSADLTGKALSVEEYTRLQQELPDCELIWDVPFQGKAIPSNTDAISVTALSDEDIATLRYFPQLTRLDGTGCEDYAQLRLAAEAYPNCTVTYLVSLAGQKYDPDTESLSLQDADAEELTQILPLFRNMKQVVLSGQLPEAQALAALREAFPDITFHWSFSWNGQTFDTTSPALDLSGTAMTYEEASELLQLLPYGQTVDMRCSGLTDEEMMALADANPEDTFLWDITIGSFTFFTGSEEIDLSGYIMESTAEIEDFLPYFPRLKKVIMCDCGLDDETMDALNKRYEDIRFVWSVKISYGSIRTDTDHFYPFKISRNLEVTDEDLYPLRYCTDIVAIDIGHMWDVTTCEWAAFMPKLKYLILAESKIDDLSPLTNCKDLVYLEIFHTPVKDYSPLLECKNLVDLNCCFTFGDHTSIARMTWLENLWWSGATAVPNAVEDLEKALPDTNLQFYMGNSVGNNGWRKLDNYKRMRDVMGMFYLQ